jgi:O-antigen ligase
MMQFLARAQTESQIEGLSSRMDWWTFAWQQFMHHPFTGLGAYAAGKFAVLGKLGVGAASQMHSDWMEVLAGTSLWGLIPFLAALVGCWVVLVRSTWDRNLTTDERQLLTEVLGVLGVITLRSFFNVELSWHAPFLYFAVVGYAEFLRRKGKQRASGAGSPSGSFSYSR